MTGQQAYERDLKRYPTYHDGSARPAWDKLSDIARWSWNHNPTDRQLLDKSIDYRSQE